VLGPGVITGASDDDPSGIGTYSVAGAQFGYGTVWASLVTYPLSAAVQEVCARIGLVTGHGLAAIIKHYFPRWVLYVVAFLLVAANTLNIGADIEAMAGSIHLVLPVVPTALAALARCSTHSHPAGVHVVQNLFEIPEMGGTCAFLIHDCGAPFARGLGAGAQVVSCAGNQAGLRLHHDVGRNPGNDHFSLYVLLAGQHGGRRKDSLRLDHLARPADEASTQAWSWAGGL
jgi:hypothetical protein